MDAKGRRTQENNTVSVSPALVDFLFLAIKRVSCLTSYLHLHLHLQLQLHRPGCAKQKQPLSLASLGLLPILPTIGCRSLNFWFVLIVVFFLFFVSLFFFFFSSSSPPSSAILLDLLCFASPCLSS
jgi:hypothetical protein